MKRRIMMISLILGITVLLGIGLSYSMWIMTNKQDSMNAIETTNKCFNVELTSESENIKLENAYPISDDAGSKLSPYSFKITNTCDWNAYYKVNLETLNKSTIDNKFIKASINNSNPQVINGYKDSDTSLKDSKIANTLKSGYLPVGGSVSFDLRLWMDYDTTIDDIKNDGSDKWAGKIVVVSNLVEDGEILAACQNKGGDLVDDGECRKYYVKLNNYVNMENISLGNQTSEIHGTYDEENETWLIDYTGGNKWFGVNVEPVEEKYNHVFYGMLTANGITGYLTSEFCNVDGGVNGCAYPKIAMQNNGDNKYSYYFSLVYYMNITEIKNYHSYLLYNQYPGINDGTLSETYFLKDYMIVDLTVMFGDGNEPDKEWCNKYLTSYIEYNAEGTMTPIKEVGEPIKTAYYDVISLMD